MSYSKRLSVILFLVLACATLGLGVTMAYLRVQRLVRQNELLRFGGAEHLNPAERLYLQGYLSNSLDELYQPAGGNQETVTFEIAAGQGAGAIATNLAQANLLTNETLFLNYLRYYGYDSQLDAGVYTIAPNLTIPQLADTLLRAYGQEITLTFIEGWRIEEMANYLNTVQAAGISGDEFLAIVQRQQPFDLSHYTFLASHPAEVTLEGFMFPDTYRVPLDATAPYLVDLMLKTFDERVTPAMRQTYGNQGLTLREAVTLASIVQREAVLLEEKPLIAGVFYNRLAQGMLLQADPTVQYAVGQWQGNWWKSPLWVDDLTLDSPYNTYVYAGLPPGPIANPGLAALQAVSTPAETDYLFFMAKCGAEQNGSHSFSVTYEEHLGYVAECR